MLVLANGKEPTEDDMEEINAANQVAVETSRLNNSPSVLCLGRIASDSPFINNF